MDIPEAEKTEIVVDNDAKRILFTTKTCPNCKIVKEMLNKKNLGYEIIDAEENEDLVNRFGITQAPTLVVMGDSNSFDKFANASNIIKYINRQS